MPGPDFGADAKVAMVTRTLLLSTKAGLDPNFGYLS
jgi:hypothetical protein